MSLRPSKQPVTAPDELTRILDAFEECPEILGPIAKLFREAYVPDMHALRLALEKEDCANFAFLAHKIKGSASYFRADHVTDIAADLEGRGEHGNLNGAHILVDQLGEALDSVSIALKQVEDLLAARQ
jgi:HPt (histidine-containing phosphotransfer) domain-containing protein